MKEEEQRREEQLYRETGREGMGRAGRAAPRTCSTLELRTHVSSPLTVSLLPPTTTVSKPSVPSSPPSPSTPVQEAPASVTPMRQAWPQDVLQVVQLQLESIRSHSVVQPNETVMSRKRGFQSSESYEDVKKQQQDELAVSPGLEVELQAQTPLPQDWEQCLDLKVRNTPNCFLLSLYRLVANSTA